MTVTESGSTVERVLARARTSVTAPWIVAVVVAVGIALEWPTIGLVLLATVVVSGAVAWSRGDAAAVLVAFSVLVLLVPAGLVIGPLGALGAPARLLGLGALIWWVGTRLTPVLGADRGRNPLRMLLLVNAWCVGASFVAGQTQALSVAQSLSTIRWLLGFGALTGVALIAIDGIGSRRRLDAVVRTIAGLGAVFATIGIVQFATRIDPLVSIPYPGLSANGELEAITERGEFARVASTALHPIEFGVVLAMLFPLALHVGLAMRSRGQVVRWIPAILIGAALPMSVSRSAIVSLFASMLVLLPAWSPRIRRRALVVGAFGLLAMRSAVPGLLGTIQGLFLGFGQDTSVSTRTDDYDTMFALFGEHPVFGRGIGTFLPEEYFFVDNQMLITLVEAGLVGLLGLAAVIFGAIAVARRVTRAGTDAETAHLVQALVAAIVAGSVSFFTYDALSFPINAQLLFLFIGCAGALWRIELRDRPLLAASPPEVGATAS